MGFLDTIFKSRKGKTNENLREESAKRISRFIAPAQFARLKQDAKSYKEAIAEAEQPWFPHRVKMQRIYIDTIQNGHVYACLQRRYNLTLLKEFGLFSGETIDEKATELLRAKWFYECMQYILEAPAFGYSLVELGDCVNNTFPELQIVKRQNVSPDRLCVSAFVYGINGINFMDESMTDENGESYYDWSVYVSTPSEIGASKCGYGYLYKVAPLEILLRNLLGFNANYIELYGQPIRWAKSVKTEGEEYDDLAESMENMGASGWIITDPNDDISLLEAGKAGTGYKSYDNLEARLEKKISKIILGHSDALDSTPGKLGGNQDGRRSAVAQALEDVETVDGRFVEQVVNDILIPKLIKLGFPISPGLKFAFKNDKEKQDIRKQKDESNKMTADYIKTLADAGYKVDAKWLADHMDIPIEEKEEVPPQAPPGAPGSKEAMEEAMAQSIKNRLNELYKIT